MTARSELGTAEAALAEALAAAGAKEGPVSGISEPEGRLAEALAELRELEQARSSLAAELEEVKASPVDPTADGQGSADIGRIADLERDRRNDIAELQRAQESFANTQVELANSTRKLRDAEGRIRELERDLGRPSKGVPTYVPNVDEPRSPSRGEPNVMPGEVAVPAGREAHVAAAETDLDATIDLQSFEHRVSSLRAGLESANDMGWEDQPHPAPEPPDPPAVPAPRSDPEPAERGRELDPDEEGLSLRERLARAAAARHRGPLS